MAIYIVYRKFRETDTDVEYHYGKSETDLNQRLVIDKSDPNRRLKEASESRMASKIVGRLLCNLEDGGIDTQAKIDGWPGGGAIQS